MSLNYFASVNKRFLWFLEAVHCTASLNHKNLTYHLNICNVCHVSCCHVLLKGTATLIIIMFYMKDLNKP